MIKAVRTSLMTCLVLVSVLYVPVHALPPPPDPITVIQGRQSQSHPIDVKWKKPDGKEEVGNIRVIFGTRTLIYDTDVTEKVAERSCGAYCEDEENHNGHAACDMSCDWGCEGIHKVAMTPRIVPLRSWREMDKALLPPLFGAGIGIRGDLQNTFGITPDSIGNHFHQIAKAAERAAVANLLRIPLDKVETDAEQNPPTAYLNIDHWVNENEPCVMHTLVFGLKKLEVHIQVYAKAVGTFPSGPMEQEFSEEPTHVFDVMVPYGQAIQDLGKKVECYCRPRVSMMPDGPYYRLGDSVYPFPGSSKLPGIEKGSYPGYGYSVTGIDMNRALLNISGPANSMGSVYLTAGTRLVPNDSSTQVMSVLRDVEIKLPTPTRAFYSGYLASLLPIAAEPETVTASIEVPVHCMEIKKKEPSSKTMFKIRASRDDALKDIFGFYEKSRHKGPWDQARTWIYTDKASLEEINKRISPEITRGQYVNALHDLSSVGALDLEDPKVQKLLDPQHLLGTAATDASTEWLIFNLSFYNPKGLVAFIDKNANLFHAAFSGQAVENGVRHVSGVIHALLNSPIESVQQAGGRFAIAAVPPAARKAVLLSNGLVGLDKLVWSENEASVLLGLDVLIAYKPKADTTDLKALQANTESPKIKAKAAEAIAAIQSAP